MSGVVSSSFIIIFVVYVGLSCMLGAVYCREGSGEKEGDLDGLYDMGIIIHCH